MKIKKPKYFEFKKSHNIVLLGYIIIYVKAGNLIAESVIRYIKRKNITKCKSISIANNSIIRTNTI